MGIPDSSLLDLIVKVRSWLYWGEEQEEEPQQLSSEFEMPKNNMCCCDCRTSFTTTLCHRFLCQSCGRSFCDDCVCVTKDTTKVNNYDDKSDIVVAIERCRLCSEMRVAPKRASEKVHPSSVSPDPLSPPCFSGDAESVRTDDHFSLCLDAKCLVRNDKEDTEDSGKNFLTPKSEYNSDMDSISCSSIRDESFSSPLVGPSPFDSPSRIDNTVQKTESHDSPSHSRVGRDLLLKNPDPPTHDHQFDTHDHEQLQRPLDFENNGLLWYPPPPEDEKDEADNGYFRSNDDEDDDYLGDSGSFFSSSGGLSSLIPEKDSEGNNNHVNNNNNKPVRAVIHGHFRALVSQLLQGQGIQIDREKNRVEGWLDIVTELAWQAANFVKPDTSRGGSMDPGDYVKVKCVATGSPSESTLVRGVVCTKNIKHKRMNSQYKNPRLIILGGALEYQRAPNQLESFNTLLQQENDHLKLIISRIEAHRPNVLLVEKSVSSYAQDYLLTKEISLVLNFKRPLLERIARCTGARITPTVDSISTTRLGHCELFRLERLTEEHEPDNQFNKKPTKTLMFFEGCSRRLGCTVLLKGASREELKKVKHVVQFAVFAAYHLSLETSFLEDEGATLPKMAQGYPMSTSDPEILLNPDSIASTTNNEVIAERLSIDQEVTTIDTELEGFESFSEHFSPRPDFVDSMVENFVPVSSSYDLALNLDLSISLNEFDDRKDQTVLSDAESPFQTESLVLQDDRQPEEPERTDENEVSSDYFADTHQSILVSFSNHCVLKGTVCERSRLTRIKFYGCFDKPLGRYLHDDLFDQTMCCPTCNEPPEAHVSCYTHQQGNLTINVRILPSLKLPGERDGKIWMWHRCLRCAHINGVPPATRRVVMSDAAWGLSFGKFLELSFSNHATANRIASCGHSLQKDCLRYYGFGSTVAFFRYSPIDILSVYLPPSVLEFSGSVQSEWFKKETSQLMGKVETLYAEISDVLDVMEGKNQSRRHKQSDTCELQNHIVGLKDIMKKERNDYISMLQAAIMDSSEPEQICVDILELNRLRRALLIGSHVWDRQLYSLDSLLRRSDNSNLISGPQPKPSFLVHSIQLKSDSFNESKTEKASLESLSLPDYPEGDSLSEHEDSNESVFESCVPAEEEEEDKEERVSDGEISKEMNSCPDESTLSDRIDSAWTGTESQAESPTLRTLGKPARVHSFDSALRVQEKIRKGLNPSFLHASSLRSFRASNEFQSSVIRTYSQILPKEAERLNLTASSTTPSFISSASISEGVRMLLPQTGQSDLVVAVYDQEPTSIISYALSSKEYENWVNDYGSEISREDSSRVSNFSSWQSFGSMDLDYMRFGVGGEDSSSSMGSLFTDTKKSPHPRLSFGDDKMKFSVTCYFAEMFDSLRKKCCSDEVDFVRSLSRCRRWNAQGGKSNVYFAKSLDERFIVKQVTKTELESFEEFAPEYFKYLTESINSCSPTCLAKVLGIYQVCTKQVKGGKETKMDMMIMENLFFKRNISRIYDLKGSTRSRYNSDTTGANTVLLDMNLLETLRTKPIFLGSKAKRSLERAIWNDTAFLAFVDVMDYSLLVGVDEERKELVLGIIDYMRQYTWDKHLETWVKASGILGGPKTASPTIISPIQYKKRFRKAMTTYFLAVPDQWSS